MNIMNRDFLLMGTNSKTGMPMLMDMFESFEDAHDAMEEDYNSCLEEYEGNSEVLDCSWIAEDSAAIGDGCLNRPIFWSIQKFEDAE